MAAAPGSAAPRRKLLPQKITGKILEWKGTFGWIQADKPINHPEAINRGGKIYLSQQDVEDEIEGIGSAVSFFVYTDGKGIGAMNCRPAGQVPLATAVSKVLQSRTTGGPAAAPAAAASRQSVSQSLIAGTIHEFKGTFGWISPKTPIDHPLCKGRVYFKSVDVDPGAKDQLQPGAEVMFSLYQDAQGLGAANVRLGTGATAFRQSAFSVQQNGGQVNSGPAKQTPTAAQAFGKGAGGSGATANLPRERLTETQTTGEVVDWKIGHGWVQPHEPLDHPEASKRGGRLYLSQKDFKGGIPRVGLLVQFHIFSDESGLGAEDCSEF